MSLKTLLTLTIVFIALGFAVMMGGFWYDVVMAGIPYQDAPPALLVEYETAKNRAATILWIGAALASVGSLLAVGTAVLFVRRLLRPTMRE